jgi:hypothetical protein
MNGGGGGGGAELSLYTTVIDAFRKRVKRWINVVNGLQTI